MFLRMINDFLLKYKTKYRCRKSVLSDIYLAECRQESEELYSRLCKFATDSSDNYFVLYREVDDVGIGSQLFVGIHQIKYAYDKGYIPIIHRHLIGTDDLYNQWEEVFEPINGVGLKNVYRNINTVFCLKKTSPYGIWEDFWKLRNNRLEPYKKLMKDNVILKKDLQEEINSEWKRMFDKNDKVVGVLMRGTDYNESVAFGHPIQPSVEQMMKKIKKVKNWTKIFIATEDQDILNAMIGIFGEKLYYIPQQRMVRDGNKTINREIREQGIDKAKLLRDYVKAIYILGKCDMLIVGNTSASSILPLIGEYEYKYRFNLGTYGDGDLSKILK